MVIGRRGSGTWAYSSVHSSIRVSIDTHAGGGGLFIYVHIHVSKISKLSTIGKKIELSISNNMVPHVFRSKVG